MSQSNDYFRCGGCGRFVLYSQMQPHYEGDKDHKPHELGVAVESPPAPLTVANPAPPPMWQGQAIPPTRPEPKTGLGMNLLLMKRSYPRTFLIWTAIVIFLTAWAVSSLYTLIVFHI